MSDANVRLRPIGDHDRDLVLAWNDEHVHLLAPMDDATLSRLIDWSDRADVIEVDGVPAGFVITFGPGTTYDSDNYRWFTQRYGEDFYYLDRIVVAGPARRGGVGRAVYDELERAAAPFARMALEVNVDPPNEASLAFHRGRGYRPVGRLGEPGHVVELMTLELPAD